MVEGSQGFPNVPKDVRDLPLLHVVLDSPARGATDLPPGGKTFPQGSQRSCRSRGRSGWECGGRAGGGGGM